jgi:hypothetical protein
MHQKDVMYKKLMSDPRVAKIERLPISDDAAADDFGKSAFLEDFLNSRGTSHHTTKRQKLTDSGVDAIFVIPDEDE